MFDLCSEKKINISFLFLVVGMLVFIISIFVMDGGTHVLICFTIRTSVAAAGGHWRQTDKWNEYVICWILLTHRTSSAHNHSNPETQTRKSFDYLLWSAAGFCLSMLKTLVRKSLIFLAFNIQNRNCRCINLTAWSDVKNAHCTRCVELSMGWKPSFAKAMQCRQTQHRTLSTLQYPSTTKDYVD